MATMTVLHDTLNAYFKELEAKKPDLTPYKVALEVGLDPNQLRKSLGGKSFSDNILEKLSMYPGFPYTFKELRLMRAKDEYPELENYANSLPIQDLTEAVLNNPERDQILQALHEVMDLPTDELKSSIEGVIEKRKQKNDKR